MGMQFDSDRFVLLSITYLYLVTTPLQFDTSFRGTMSQASKEIFVFRNQN